MGRLDGVKGDEYVRIFQIIRTALVEVRMVSAANDPKNSKPLTPSSRPKALCQWRWREKTDGVRFHPWSSASPFAANSIGSRRRKPAGRTAKRATCRFDPLPVGGGCYGTRRASFAIRRHGFHPPSALPHRLHWQSVLGRIGGLKGLEFFESFAPGIVRTEAPARANDSKNSAYSHP
jgi:hypothetical protein